MKSKILQSIVCVLSLVLVWGVGGTCFADNAAQVDVKISYPCAQGQDPCDTEEAVSRAGSGGDVVNVYITLLDANGDPATHGPGGEDLKDVTATILSNLGTTGSITPNEFLVDSDLVTFDSPEGPAARLNVDYTDATPGEDTITVTVPATPDPITGTAKITVVAPPASSLVVRTYRDLSPPTIIFTPLDEPNGHGQQYNNGGDPETAGSDVNYWVIAADGGNRYTFAPELGGQQVTVRAYADFSADGDNIGLDAGTDGVNYEEDLIAEDTSATFSNGIAQGTITINNGGPGTLLDIVLTATVSVNQTTINTTQMTGAGIEDVGAGGANLDNGTDDDVDYVPMRSGQSTKLVIGEDLYVNGTLIQEKDCYIVLDDGTTNTTTPITVIQTDALGNAVRSSIGREVDGDLDDNLENHPLRDSSGSAPAAGSGIWNIAAAAYKDTDFLTDGPGTVNNGAIMSGDFTVTSTGTGLTGDSAGIFLLPSAIAGTLDLMVDTDADGLAINAGSTVTMNITSAGSTLAVETGDSLLITANAAGGLGAQLLSTPAQSFTDATDELMVTAADGSTVEPGMQISFLIYGPSTPTTTGEAVTVTMKNLTKCDMMADNSTTKIADIAPIEPATQVAVTGVAAGVKYSGTLKDDPIVITSSFIGDGATVNHLLAGGPPFQIQTWDLYDNMVDGAPTYTAVSSLGIPTVNGVTGALDLKYPSSAVGLTDTITCSVTGIGSRHFEIQNIIAAAITGEATALEIRQEGPQGSGPVNPLPGGEAIIRVSANGTSAANRSVTISFGDDSVEGAELRDLDGDVLTTPHTTTLVFQPSLQDKRLVVSAPAAGDVIINAEDLSTSPLDSASLTLTFGPGLECEVTIEPDAPTVAINQTKQFSASTVCNGDSVTGSYTWEVMDMGTTGSSGSTIDANGLYTAGTTAGTDTVKVTDTVNNVTDTTTVTVIECEPEVTISPASPDPVDFGETIQFSATTTCNGDPLTGSYSWAVTSTIGSSIDSNGLYTAGSTAGTDTVTVTDTANNNVTDTATVVVEPPMSCVVSPDPMLRSNLIWLPVIPFVTIEGTDTNFAAFSTTISYSPDNAVIPLPPLVLSPTAIWQGMIVNPAWLAGVEDDQTVTATVTTGAEVVECDSFDINLLPFPLDTME